MRRICDDGSLHLTHIEKNTRRRFPNRRWPVFMVGTLLLATIACERPRQIARERLRISPPSKASTQLLSPVTKTSRPSSTPTSFLTATKTSISTSTPIPLSQGNVDKIQPLYVLGGPTDSVTQVVISPDSEIVAASSLDETLWMWRMSDGRLVNTLKGHTDGVLTLAFSPDATLLVSGSSDRTVIIWRVDEGSLVRAIHDSFNGRVLRVAFSPDGSLFAMADDLCFIQIRRTASGVLLRSLAQPNCLARLEGTVSAWGLAFSPDGEYILAGESRPCCGGSLHQWAVDEVRAPVKLLEYDLRFRDIVHSPDGSMLAVVFDSSPVFWLTNTDGGEPLRTFEGHSYQVNTVAFSPNGELLVSGSRDRKVRIWRVEDGALLYTLEGHASSVNDVTFSPDGGTIASCSEDGMVILWGFGR